jgi:cobalt/nickel transport system permease protein
MRLDPRRSRLLLAGWAASVLGLSAAKDPAVLLAAGVLAIILFRRGSLRVARRVLLAVAPPVTALSLASFAWLAWSGRSPPAAPFVALALRALVIAFATLSVLARVDLLGAARPSPTLTRLLVLCLAQIQALRRLATESVEGLRSRLPRRPRTRDVVAGAGAVTVALLTLSVRNARETGEAMRSRGFE